MAQALAEAGATVIVSGRDEEARSKIEESAQSKGLNIRAIYGEVSTQGGCADLISEFQRKSDRLDVLVNNAGANDAYGSLDQYPYDQWAKSFSLNATGVFEVSRLLIPMLRESASRENPSRIIVSGSIDGERPSDLSSYAYGASKAAASHIARGLAKALVKDSINVNCLILGPFKTRMMVEAMPHIRSAVGMAVPIDQMVPVGTIGQYADIAGPVTLLASRAGRYITGETITIDGGLTTLR